MWFKLKMEWIIYGHKHPLLSEVIEIAVVITFLGAIVYGLLTTQKLI